MDYVTPRERFSYFREGLCQSFLASTPELPRGSAFTARLDHVPFPSGSVALLNSSPVFTRRTASDIKSIRTQFIGLQLYLAGSAHFSIKKDEVLLEKKGDLMLHDSDLTFEATILPGSCFSLFNILFDRSKLNGIVGSDQPVVRRDCKHRPLSLALADCTGVFARRYAKGTLVELTSLFEACLMLTAAALLQDRDYIEHASSASDVVGAGFLATIKSFLDHNLADPLLSPSHVATRFGISVRYVHKLFQEDADTFSSYVLSNRLERARLEMLAIPKANLPLATIIYRWGFRDMAGFHRNFKKRYGLAPGQMRALAGSRGAKGP